MSKAIDCSLVTAKDLNDKVDKWWDEIINGFAEKKGYKGNIENLHNRKRARKNAIKEEINKLRNLESSPSSTESAVTQLRENIQREMADLDHSLNMELRMQERIDTAFEGLDIKKTSAGRTIDVTKRVVEEEFQYQRNIIRGNEDQFDAHLNNLLSPDNLETRGKRVDKSTVKKVRTHVTDAFADGHETVTYLIKTHGWSAEKANNEYLKALRQEHYKGDELLDNIAQVYKEQKKYTENVRKILDPHARGYDNHVIPIRPYDLKVSRMSEKEFVDGMKSLPIDWELTLGKKNISEGQKTAEILSYRESILDNRRSSASGYKSTLGSGRQIKFLANSPDAEAKFLALFGNMDRENVGTMAFGHQRAEVKRATLKSLVGSDVNEYIEGLKGYLSYKTEGKADEIIKGNNDPRDFVDTWASHLETEVNNNYEMNDIYNNINNAGTNIISYAALGWQTIRELFLDGPVIGAINKSIFSGNKLFGYTVGPAIRYLYNMAKIITGGFRINKRKEAKTLLKSVGLALEVQAHEMNTGVIDKTFKPKTIKLSEDIKGFESKASKLGYNAAAYTNIGVEQAAKTVNSITASNGIHSSGKTFYGTMVANQISEAILEDQSSNAMDSLFKYSGIGAAERKALKEVQKIDTSKLKLNEGKASGIIDPRNVHNLSDELIDSIEGLRRTTETHNDTKIRLEYALRQAMQELLDIYSPRPMLRGTMLNTKRQTGVVKTIAGMGTRFTTTPNTAWVNLKRLLMMNNGKNPNLVGLANPLKEIADVGRLLKNSPGAMGVALVNGALAAHVYLWIKDFLSEKTPRDISPESLYEAMSQNGFGGYTANTLNSLKYSKPGDIPTTANILVNPIYDWGSVLTHDKRSGRASLNKKKFRAWKSTAAIIPFANSYMFRKSVDNQLRKNMNIKTTAAERKEMRELGQKPLGPVIEDREWAELKPGLGEFFDDLLGD